MDCIVAQGADGGNDYVRAQDAVAELANRTAQAKAQYTTAVETLGRNSDEAWHARQRIENLAASEQRARDELGRITERYLIAASRRDQQAAAAAERARAAQMATEHTAPAHEQTNRHARSQRRVGAATKPAAKANSDDGPAEPPGLLSHGRGGVL